MKYLIVANWKLNPISQKDAKKLFDGIKKKAKSKNAEIIVCPPFVYLDLLRKSTLSLSKGISIGAQNVAAEEKGAFTGEISAMQIKDLKVEHVIIGHSERRKYFNENNEIINKKIKKALEAGLKIIFCIGENTSEDKQTILEIQITEGLKNISRDNLKQIVIAYEPVWAIGTGNNCSVDQTLSSVLLIKKTISHLYSREVADNTRILYGGSVNSKNSADYLKQAGVNGLLVGGASLFAEEFAKIVKSAD